jgi:hypothetical protein
LKKTQKKSLSTPEVVVPERKQYKIKIDERAKRLTTHTCNSNIL